MRQAMSTAIRYVHRDGRYEVWRGDMFYGTVQNTGTKWAGVPENPGWPVEK